MQALKIFLLKERQANKQLYPSGDQIFSAFDHTPFNQVKVVILGQDPYHGPGQAHGLCFSVQPGIKVPPSLQNIYKELASDCGIQPISHGYLMEWANQGVLLLNSVMTVTANQPASHQGQGWEIFTDAVISKLNEQKEHLVFMLTASHPSPFSVRGFLGCKHFSKANAYLQEHGKEPIRWQLSELKELKQSELKEVLV
jgi:uracil-DNA glycosylase